MENEYLSYEEKTVLSRDLLKDILESKTSVVEGRLPTGVFGLDDHLEGGIRFNTVNVVLGTPGAGKTTFAIQFLIEGLRRGEKCFFISLEEPWEKIIRDYKTHGWYELEDDYAKGRILFTKTSGSDFKEFVVKHLPILTQGKFFKTGEHVRIVIDPLTPMIWAIKDKSDQRQVLSEMFKILNMIGTTVITIEQPTTDLSKLAEEVTIPLFLADGAFLLIYLDVAGEYNRALKIVKMRGTKIGEGIFNVSMVPGLGLVVETQKEEFEPDSYIDSSQLFADALKQIQRKYPPEIQKYIVAKLKVFQEKWDMRKDPSLYIEAFLKQYLK